MLTNIHFITKHNVLEIILNSKIPDFYVIYRSHSCTKKVNFGHVVIFKGKLAFNLIKRSHSHELSYYHEKKNSSKYLKEHYFENCLTLARLINDKSDRLYDSYLGTWEGFCLYSSYNYIFDYECRIKHTFNVGLLHQTRKNEKCKTLLKDFTLAKLYLGIRLWSSYWWSFSLAKSFREILIGIKNHIRPKAFTK